MAAMALNKVLWSNMAFSMALCPCLELAASLLDGKARSLDTAPELVSVPMENGGWFRWRPQAGGR